MTPPLRRPRQALATGLVGLVIMVLCLWVGWRMLGDFDSDRMWGQLAQISLANWTLALFATGASFLALGQYDAIWHRLLRTGVPQRRAARIGMAAIAVGQALGINAVTSGIARWRGLPEVPPRRIATLSAAVGLSFMAAWAVCAAGLSLWVGWIAPPLWITWVVGLCTALALIAVLIRLPLNQRKAAIGLTLFTALDLALAGTVLWLLLPAGAVVPWDVAVAAYVLALGLGLISNSPGGVGPFELMLLTLLPTLPAEDLVAALLAFRIVYYLIPFCVGAVSLWQRTHPSPPPPRGPAAWGLSRQSGEVAHAGNGWQHRLTALGITVGLGDPVGPAPCLMRHAHYKIGPDWAARARKAGWHITRIADEAVLDLTDWTLDGSGRKRLRQALRRAAARGITTTLSTGDLPLDDMRRIATRWAQTQGGELGLTMGRFCPSALMDQRVVLIHHHDVLVGFITCDTGADDWALDLIRYLPNLPDGAVHAALVAAMDAARQSGARGFSLGAVPALPEALAPFGQARDGLRQFKQVFRPTWQPRYFAAPDRPTALIAALALLWGIQRPLARKVSQTHHLHASFDVALAHIFRETDLSVPGKAEDDTDRQRPLSVAEDPRLALG